MPEKKRDSDPDGWARLRFAVIGPLLADPPSSGELGARLKALAAKDWCYVARPQARFVARSLA